MAVGVTAVGVTAVDAEEGAGEANVAGGVQTAGVADRPAAEAVVVAAAEEADSRRRWPG